MSEPADWMATLPDTFRTWLDGRRVDDVEQATTDAVEAIQGTGLIFGQQTTTDPTPRTVLTIKVLPEDFAETLVALKQGLGGKVERETVSTDDVTERVVDLESRITTVESSVERIRLLLGDARDLNTIRSLEEQLLERETVLEVLRGQLKPRQCPAFGTRCTPEHPLGAPMVSSEGACAAYFRYRSRGG